MSRVEIKDALDARLFAVVGIPDADHRDLGNSAYEPVADERWISRAVLFGDERLRSLPAKNGLIKKTGTLRVLVCEPLNIGEAASDDLVDLIKEQFPAGLTLTSGSTRVHIDGCRSYAGGRDIKPNYWTVPVDVRWHVYGTNTLN